MDGSFLTLFVKQLKAAGLRGQTAAVFRLCSQTVRIEALIEKAQAVQRSILNDASFPVEFWERSFDDHVRFQLISGPFKLDLIDLAVIEQEANTGREATSSGDPVPRQVGVHFDQIKSASSEKSCNFNTVQCQNIQCYPHGALREQQPQRSRPAASILLENQHAFYMY